MDMLMQSVKDDGDASLNDSGADKLPLIQEQSKEELLNLNKNFHIELEGRTSQVEPIEESDDVRTPPDLTDEPAVNNSNLFDLFGSETLAAKPGKKLIEMDSSVEMTEERNHRAGFNTMQGKLLSQINNTAYDSNKLSQYHNIDNVKEYLEKILFKLDLKQLYEIKDVGVFNDQNEFCPVLLKLGKKMEHTSDRKYLLQVWQRGGLLIFERSLDQEVYSWNIFGQLFFWQEANDPKAVYVLKCSGNRDYSKLFRIEIDCLQPREKPFEEFTLDPNSPYQAEKDPVHRGIGYSNGFLIIHSNNGLIYTPIEDQLERHVPQTSGNLERNIIVEASAIRKINCKQNQRLVNIVETQDQKAALTMQNIKTGVICFCSIKSINHDSLEISELGYKCLHKSDKAKCYVLSIDSFIVEASNDLNSSEVENLDSEETDQSSRLHVGLVRRSDGSVDIFVDFCHVSYFTDRLVVDIEFDFKQVYFKTLSSNSHQTSEKTSRRKLQPEFAPQTELWQCRLSWRDRIGFGCSKKMMDTDQIDIIKHRRMRDYFDLYKNHMSFSTFYFLSHRNYISYVDLSDRNLEFTTLHPYESHVTNMAIHRRLASKQGHSSVSFDKSDFNKRFNIMVTLDNDSFSKIRIQNGGVSQIGIHQDNSFVLGQEHLPGRLVRLWEEKDTRIAIFCLFDDSIAQVAKEQDGRNIIQTLMESPYSSAKTTLKIYRKKQWTELIKQTDIAPYLTRDIQLEPFHLHENDLDYVRITNEVLGEAHTFQLTKKHKTLRLEFLEDAKLGQQKFEPSQNDKYVGFIYASGSEFQGKEKYLVYVFERNLYIYDSENCLRHRFENIPIKSAIYVDDCYLYGVFAENFQKIKHTSYPKQEGQEPTVKFIPSRQKNGLYCMDISRLINNQVVDIYSLVRTIRCINSSVKYSKFTERISMLSCFNELVMLPFPHRNTISFLGMSNQSDYLIWHEQEGFFSALSKNTNMIHTWSVATGKHVFQEPSLNLKLSGYEIYQASKSDNTFKSNFMNSEKRTLQLFKAKECSRSTYDIELQDDIRLDLCSPKGKLLFAMTGMSDFLAENEGQLCRSKTQAQKGKPESRFDEATGDPDWSSNYEKTRTERHYFTFKVVSMFWESSGKICVEELYHFEHGLLSNSQVMHVSEDSTRVMVIQQNRRAQIYERVFIEDSEDEKLAELVPLIRVSQYPSLLLVNRCKANTLFSPNFDSYLDVDFTKGYFVIRSVQNQSQIQQIIPKDQLSLETSEADATPESVNELASRIWFMTDDLLRVVNKQGHDVYFQVSDMKVVSLVSIDNFNVNYYQDPNYHREKTPLLVRDVFERLVRRSQEHKVHIEHSRYFHNEGLLEDNGDKNYLYSKLYRVDYSQLGTTEDSQFMAELSFTILDWLILSKLIHHPKFSIESIDREQQAELCFNILPLSQGPIHKLAQCSSGDDDEESGIQNINKTVNILFELLKHGFDFDSPVFQRKTALEMPILQDVYGRTSIETALDCRQHTSQTFYWKDDTLQQSFYQAQLEIYSNDWQKIFKCGRRKKKGDQRQLNVSLAAMIFAHIKDYSYLHSGPLLAEAVIKSVRAEVPGLSRYLESRLVDSGHQMSYTQKPVAAEITNSFTKLDPKDENKQIEIQYGMIVEEMWPRRSVLVDKVFEVTGPEKRMKLRYFDVPALHQNDEFGRKFITALSENEDIELFKQMSVQAIVNYHWKDTKIKLWSFFMLPYIIQLGTFTYWSNVVLTQMADDVKGAEKSQYWCTLILTLTCGWFLLAELNQLVQQRFLGYILSVWNYVESLPLILIMYNIIRSQSDEPLDIWFYRIQSIAAVLQWLKFLYFLRSFMETAYFIRILTCVLQDMTQFMIVLVITIIAFGDAFYSLSTSVTVQEEPVQPYIRNFSEALQYSYLLTLGEFSFDSYDWFQWLMFLVASIMNLIIMLNLLIAIISSTYEDVIKDQTAQAYKERVSLIHDIQMLTFWCQRCLKRKIKKDRLLFFAWEDPDNEDAIPDYQDADEAQNQQDASTRLLESVKETNEKLTNIMNFVMPANLDSQKDRPVVKQQTLKVF